MLDHIFLAFVGHSKFFLSVIDTSKNLLDVTVALLGCWTCGNLLVIAPHRIKLGIELGRTIAPHNLTVRDLVQKGIWSIAPHTLALHDLELGLTIALHSSAVDGLVGNRCLLTSILPDGSKGWTNLD